MSLCIVQLIFCGRSWVCSLARRGVSLRGLYLIFCSLGYDIEAVIGLRAESGSDGACGFTYLVLGNLESS